MMTNKDTQQKHIIFAACETVPFSKTGGLADVVGELSQEMAKKDHQVLVVSPYYPKDHKVEPRPEVVDTIDVPFDGGNERIHIRTQKLNGVTHAFIDHPAFDQQRIGGYGDVDVRRNVLLSCAVPHVAAAIGKGFEAPDIVHAHDWHTGYLPAIMKHGHGVPEGFKNAKSLFTIHNGAYHGVADMTQALRWANLPQELADSPINHKGYANAMTAGAGFADMVTTVSETYGEELTSGQQEPALALGELYPVSGVVNGLDESWNPAHSHFNRPTFSSNNLSGKDEIKRELCEHFNLESTRPTIGIVSRIRKEQKGLDVVVDAIDELVEQGWNIVVAGDGDEILRNELLKQQSKHAGHVAYHNGWSDQELTHLITAGSDAYLVPSVYEPCGLTQLQAMRSGSIPIVTNTGGLADTVDETRGFVFAAPPTKAGLLAATKSARAAYNDKDAWSQLIQNAMEYDSSWKKSADAYDAFYDEVLNKPSKAPSLTRQHYHERHGAPVQDAPPKKINTRNEHFQHLRCYNMYPRQYDDLTTMRDDIGRIKDMGFNAVWVNPLNEVGEIPQPDWTKYNADNNLLPEADKTVKHSLYATTNPYQINPEFAPKGIDSQQAVKDFTKAARDADMAALCDVAFSHIALDSPYVTSKKTAHWFERDENGKPVRQGINAKGEVTAFDDDGNINPKMVWADIAKFDYSNLETRQEIIEQFWQPYMDHLVDQGFTGMRVDSVAQNNPDVLEEVLRYFKQRVEKVHGIAADDVIILGETLGQKLEDYQKTTQLSHAYSSAFWIPGTRHSVADAHDKDAPNFWKTQHENDANWLTADMREMENTLLSHDNGLIRGGAIGYAGSHDEQPIVNDFIAKGYTLDVKEFKQPDNSKKLIDLTSNAIHYPKASPAEEETIKYRSKDDLLKLIDTDKAERAMREKMAQTMLTPNGGYFLFAGDEYMQAGYRSVFDNHQRGTGMADLTRYVTDINRMTAELPAIKQGAWATRRLNGIRDDLVVIERHGQKGYEGTTDVMIVSTEPDGKVPSISAEDIDAICNEVLVENKDAYGQVLSVGKHPTAHEAAQAFNGSDNNAKLRIHTESRIALALQLGQEIDAREPEATLGAAPQQAANFTPDKPLVNRAPKTSVIAASAINKVPQTLDNAITHR